MSREHAVGIPRELSSVQEGLLHTLSDHAEHFSEQAWPFSLFFQHSLKPAGVSAAAAHPDFGSIGKIFFR